MAIDYTKIGWDTSKYVNPTNMNQMDNGIKAACDGVDAINAGGVVKLSTQGYQTISVTYASNQTLALKSGTTSTLLRLMDKDNNLLGYFGANANKAPIWQDYNNTQHEIALKDDVIATHKKTFTATGDTFLLPTGWKRVECIGVISGYRVCVSVGYNDGLTCAGFAAGYHDGTRSFSITKSNADVLTLQALINLDSVLVYVSF